MFWIWKLCGMTNFNSRFQDRSYDKLWDFGLVEDWLNNSEIYKKYLIFSIFNVVWEFNACVLSYNINDVLRPPPGSTTTTLNILYFRRILRFKAFFRKISRASSTSKTKLIQQQNYMILRVVENQTPYVNFYFFSNLHSISSILNT